MTRVALILASEPGISEVFIREKINGVNSSDQVQLDVYCDNWFAGFRKSMVAWYLFKCAFNLSRVLSFYKKTAKHNFKRRLSLVLINLPLLTTNKKYNYVHFSFSNLACGRAFLGEVLGAKTTLSLRGYDITFFPINHPRAYDDVWDYIDKIHYNSTDLYKWALRWGAYPSIPCSYISAAVNDSFLLKESEKSFSDVLVITSIGRLHWKKGLEFALLSMRELKKKGIRFAYTIYGLGPELEKLGFLIERLDLSEEVKVYGHVEHIKIPAILDCTDVLLVPSLQEGCSNIALEAQARGCYCLAFDAEGMNEIIKENSTGNVVPIGDWRQMARKLEIYAYLNENDKLLNSKAAVQWVRRHFSRSTQIEKWVDFFLN